MIREQIGQPQISCKDYDTEILPAVGNIEVNVKEINQYFDPSYYANYTEMESIQQLSSTFLDQSFG
jgi:hypothetical protein